MRPIKLELEGFTSFRQRAELQLSGLDLFAITGPTGAGKSSLLDAITYVLFGRTARLGKTGTARELVSQGSSNMSVSLEFHAGNHVYKVLRVLRGGSAKGQLAKQSAEGEWISETGSIREIDAAIQRIVGLDFDGFTRAVILPQGKFDEFLRGDIRHRREVLKDLLSLQIFEKMMQGANAKAQNFTADARRIDSQIDADVSDETKNELENSIAGLQTSEADQSQLIAKLEAGQSIAEELSEYRIRQQGRQAELEAAERESSAVQGELQKARTALEEKQAALQKIDTAISEVAYDPDEHFRIAQLIPQVRRLGILKNEIVQLEEKRDSHQRDLGSDSGELEEANSALADASKACREHERNLQVAKRSLETLLNRYGLPQAVRSLGPALKGLADQEREMRSLQSGIDGLQTRLSGKHKALDELSAARAEAEGVKAAAEQRLEELKLKHRAVELRHDLRPGEPCPVCEQKVMTMPALTPVADLDDAKRSLKESQTRFDLALAEASKGPGIFDLIEKEIAHKAERLEGLSTAVSSVHERVRAMLGAEPGPGSLEQLEHLAVSVEKAQGDVARLEGDSGASRDAEFNCRTNVESLKHRCESHRQRLDDTSELIQRMQTECAEVEQRFGGVPAVAVLEQRFSELEQAKSRKENLEKQRAEAHTALNTAQTHIAVLGARLESETERAQRAKREGEEAAQQVQAAATRLENAVAPLVLTVGQELEGLKQELKAAHKLLRDVESERKEKQVRLAAVVAKLKKNQDLREQGSKLKHFAAVYHELGTLLSADHFQDYMLRSSYRLLALEGSRYFEDLTGGRYSFHSDQDEFSVRDHSNGDELRSVSTLSGGESFLASLSLALALAQSIFELSGERGAVALESLFLDEGFSTLDPETLSKVADALPALQKKGRLIGIITHVESLAEQLPARIEIVKTPTGSQILQSAATLEVAAASA